jgi:hypothetical protein
MTILILDIEPLLLFPDGVSELQNISGGDTKQIFGHASVRLRLTSKEALQFLLEWYDDLQYDVTAIYEDLPTAINGISSKVCIRTVIKEEPAVIENKE